MNGWIISGIATILSLLAYWLYGNRDQKAPIFGLLAGLLWIGYIVRFGQWPLLLPTGMRIVIDARNLYHMTE